MPTEVIAFFPLIGLALGSFGTVLIERMPAGHSIGGRSRCPRCKCQLQWFDLLPVVSYIMLGGRCRRCGKAISSFYPLTELASMAVFLGAALFHRNDPPAALTTALVVWALLITSIIDARHRRIPDMLTAVVGVAAIISAVDAGTVLSAIGGASLCVVWFGGQWMLSGGRWVGSGDILLGAALGLWLGAISSVGMLLLAYVFGMIWIVTLLSLGKIRLGKGAQVAFGPILALAAVATHAGLADWYLAMIF